MKSLYRLLLCIFPLVCLGLTGQAQDQPRQHVGRVLDWSYHHMIVGGGLSAADLGAAKAEPRILFHLAERNLPSVDGRRLAGGRGNGRDGGDRRPEP